MILILILDQNKLIFPTRSRNNLCHTCPLQLLAVEASSSSRLEESASALSPFADDSITDD